MKSVLIVCAALYSVAGFAAQSPLDQQIQTMITKSLPHLACNLDIGAKGSVIASPENLSPNYYFHWVRDSALIVDSLTRLMPFISGTPSEARMQNFIADFVVYSQRLQNSPTPYGEGEVRFNPDGSIDSSVWPRPQYDGPALRALALMNYYRANKTHLSQQLRRLIGTVVYRDLEAVAKYHDVKGFDLWEYSIGFHFYTRMVQASALHEGNRFFGEHAQWRASERELYGELEHHWNEAWQVIAFNDGPAFDADGNPIPTDPLRYDTSVVLAVNHGRMSASTFDLMDSRVWTTLSTLEDYFLGAFPVNAGKKIGPAMGRHKGDGYYGGNAFFFLTAGYAEYSFRLASQTASSSGQLTADSRRMRTLTRVLQTALQPNQVIPLPSPELAEAFAREGDAFLKTMLDAIPADGTMAEQLSKVDGSPASAHNLSWSYGSLLTAILQREQWRRSSVDFSKLDFTCPNPN